MSKRGDGTCVLNLVDLCIAGKPSKMGSVTLPLDYLRTVIAGGALQLSLANGYVLFRRTNDDMHIEFKGVEDSSMTRATIGVKDLSARLDAIMEASESLMFAK